MFEFGKTLNSYWREIFRHSIANSESSLQTFSNVKPIITNIGMSDECYIGTILGPNIANTVFFYYTAKKTGVS